MTKYPEPTPGAAYGSWVVVKEAPKPIWAQGGSGRHYECRCVCGTVRIVRGYMLRAGRTKSCGCQNGYSAHFGGKVKR